MIELDLEGNGAKLRSLESKKKSIMIVRGNVQLPLPG